MAASIPSWLSDKGLGKAAQDDLSDWAPASQVTEQGEASKSWLQPGVILATMAIWEENQDEISSRFTLSFSLRKH